MVKVYINEEEVIANQNFTIQKHMLNTPSVVLNNVCPKSWCENKDYTTNFYHPQDYSKCKIQDETYYPDLPGTTVSSTNASLTITDADTTKLCELTNIEGNTTQSGTPTPTTPQPINVVTGKQDIVVCGKNLLPYPYQDTTKTDGGITWTDNEDGTITVNGTNTSTGTKYFNLQSTNSKGIFLKAGTYTASIGSSSNVRATIARYDNVSTVITTIPANNSSVTFTLTEDIIVSFVLAINKDLSASNVLISPMIEVSSSTTTFEKYKGKTYEINLGKNLLRNSLEILKANNVAGTWSDNIYTINGTTFTCNSDGSITVNGAPSSNTNFYINRTGANYQTSYLEAGTYYLTSHETTGSNTTWKTQYQIAGTSYNVLGTGSNRERKVQVSADTNIQALLVIYSGYNPNGATFYPMISKSQGTDYAPYKTPIELCKIGNYQDFIKKGTGKNLFNDTIEVGTINSSGNNSSSTTNMRNVGYIDAKPQTTYTISTSSNCYIGIRYYNSSKTFLSSGTTAEQPNTFTTPENCAYVRFVFVNITDITIRVQLEESSSATSYEPYGMYNKWYIEKQIGKVVLDGSESWTYGATSSYQVFYSDLQGYLKTETITTYCNYYKSVTNNNGSSNAYSKGNNTISLYYPSGNINRVYIRNDSITSKNDFTTWLSTHNTIVYYVLATPTYTEITDSELLSQLNAIELLNGLNNISISSGDLPGEITIHYNYQVEHTDIDLLFCGVVKNSGNISLNPREPHYSSLQILDFKTFLSEGETLDYVIYQKTILEAINQVIGTISEYGFVLGNVEILNPNDIIGAYSTKDKTAYDVFNYIADITQSRWTTRLVDENTIAIDFYDPTLMPQGKTIDYTSTFFNTNLIDDMKYSYGTNNYRNKQVMVSNQVVGSLSQIQTIYSNGYQDQYIVDLPVAEIQSIYVNDVSQTFATNIEYSLGINADFYYTVNSNIIESEETLEAGSKVEITYIPIVEGRQVITNNDEITRVAESTGRKGIVARYENRNDATTSLELQKIGESYIKYKGTPEIKLTIQSRKNIWEVGQRVQFNAPIEDLDTEYMVRSKKINYIANQQESTGTLFYTYELISSFNSETEINYFDNQRAKANGNIGDGEYISRNIDIENVANVIFYDTEATEITVDGDNTLNSILNSPLIS